MIAHAGYDFVDVLNGFVKKLKKKQVKTNKMLPSKLPNAFNPDRVARQYGERLFKN